MTDNKRLKGTFEYDLMDAPMIVHALQIAANTALMCGNPDARVKLQAYRDLLKATAPACAFLFNEEHWAEMGMALVTAKKMRIELGLPPYMKGERWRREKAIKIDVDGFVIFTRDARFVGSCPEFNEVCEYLKQIAPLTCEITTITELQL